jgi:putative ABC transport system permease protein
MLFHSKLRSWLTIFGIVIGVGAVVGIISIGDNMQAQVQKNLASIDLTNIIITPGYSRAQSGGHGFSGVGDGTGTAHLTKHDIDALRGVQGVKYITGQISGSVDISFNGENASLPITGVDPQVWQYMSSLKMGSGRLLESADNNVAVIGSGVASGIYKKNIGVNQIITIKGKSFRVVGILKEEGGSNDRQIYLPINIAVNIIPDSKRAVYNLIQVKTQSVDIVDKVSAMIEKRLMISRHINKADNKDFTIIAFKSMAQTITSMTSSMTLFLGAIAAVSLIVGAVGIANTMFTSVLEKTRDIGTMKAIGAKNKDILMIFLLNSAMVGLVGGILGVMLGSVVSSALQAMAGGEATTASGISLKLIFQGLLLAVSVGVISGVVPAYRASRLKPVDALRYE